MTWTEWHVLTVEHDADDRVVDVMHPTSCAFAVHVDQRHDTVRYEWQCMIHHEIENNAFDSLLEGVPVDAHSGLTFPGMYRTRGCVIETPTMESVWTEIDYVFETERLVVQP